MAALIPKGIAKGRSVSGPLILGVELRDHREEIFVVMVCDGLPMGLAFRRAGFTSKDHNAPSNLWALPRVQVRAQSILEARRATGVVSLGEVTSMLKRVFAGANAAEEYSAAHNAAFSLARLYGHVTDRATLEVIRRPSRDPDAPSEQALGDWVAGLPALNGSGPEGSQGSQGLLGPFPHAPAAPLGPEPSQNPNEINGLAGPEPLEPSPEPGPEPYMHVDVHRNQLENPNEINDLAEFRTLACIGTAGGRSENGAPVGPVTVTPTSRGHSDLLGPEPPGGSEKGAPLNEVQVPVLTGGFPPIEDLF